VGLAAVESPPGMPGARVARTEVERMAVRPVAEEVPGAAMLAEEAAPLAAMVVVVVEEAAMVAVVAVVEAAPVVGLEAVSLRARRR
jgi:hypothetical protein